MATCFMIQPFDNGKFDKRFDDVYRPAIEAAGLEPYRVDQDPSVSVLIDGIEEGIRLAAVCLADITSDNPNVWYELGFASAVGRPVVMVCSNERQEKKYPFDIQHRSIIPYQADSPSDFESLKDRITKKVKALIAQGESLDQLSNLDPIAPFDGLSQPEIILLGVLGGASDHLSSLIGMYEARRDSVRAGLTPIGFNLEMRGLTAKEFLFTDFMWDDDQRENFPAVSLTAKGWEWIEKNQAMFRLRRPDDTDQRDDVPF